MAFILVVYQWYGSVSGGYHFLLTSCAFCRGSPSIRDAHTLYSARALHLSGAEVVKILSNASTTMTQEAVALGL